MKLTVNQIIGLVLFVSSLAGTWGVTVYKVSQMEEQLSTLQTNMTELNGNVQLLLGLYARERIGELPDQEWIFPSHP